MPMLTISWKQQSLEVGSSPGRCSAEVMFGLVVGDRRPDISFGRFPRQTSTVCTSCPLFSLFQTPKPELVGICTRQFSRKKMVQYISTRRSNRRDGRGIHARTFSMMKPSPIKPRFDRSIESINTRDHDEILF